MNRDFADLDQHLRQEREATEAGEAPLFRCVTDLEGKSVPPREWHVPDIIPSGTVTMLGGDGGTGKSLLAKQLAVATAAGKAWIGRPVERAGTALFLSAEDDEAELHRRFTDVAAAEDIRLGDLTRLHRRSLAGEDALLAMLDRKTNALLQTQLYHRLDADMKRHAPTLLVLDTLADLHSGEENNRAHARQFIGMLRGLAIRHACAVVMLAHPSLSGLNSGSGTSGSTGWNNSVRSRLYLERVIQDGYEPDPDARVLRSMKANYARTGGEISLRWESGVFVAQTPPTGLDRLSATAKAERVFLKLLQQAQEQGRRVNHAGGPTYAPKVFEKHPDSEGITKRTFGRAMEALLASGKIKIVEDGPPSKRRQTLEVAG